MTDKTPEEERDARSATIALNAAKKLFDLVRPEAVALGGALVDRGVRAVVNGDIKIRVGAGPAPGRKKAGPVPKKGGPAPKTEETPSKPKAAAAKKTVIEADFVVTSPSDVDTSKVATAAEASTIEVEVAPPKEVKTQWRCKVCHGTWSSVAPSSMCQRCGVLDWREGA